MSETNVNQVETVNIQKSKLLYLLHIMVPLCLVAFSSISMMLSFLQSSTSQTLTLHDTTNSTNSTLITELSNQDKIIELLNLDNGKNQSTLSNVICVFNFLFSCLSVVYSKLMNSDSHEKGNKIIELISSKNTVLEQLTTLTTLTNTTRNPSVQYNRELWEEPLRPVLQIPSQLITPNENRPNSVSNSTVYITPYQHEPIN